MATVEVGTVEVLGETLTMKVNGSGMFSLYLDEQALGGGDSLEAAKRKARAELSKRRVEVAVPFQMEDGRRGVARRRHARDRTTLVEIAGERDALAWNAQVFKPDVAPEVLAEYVAAQQRITEARQKVTEIEREHTFSIGNAVDRAVEEAVAAAAEAA